ncbi:MAG: hypothetical protein HRF50_00240 [Phycisphaerae bacterium]|jgi:hypothetical protein
MTEVFRRMPKAPHRKPPRADAAGRSADAAETGAAPSPWRASVAAERFEPSPLLMRWGYIGPVLLLLAATAYGVLEVHSSTDTWIGLAAGKQILESESFPTQDTFSYTFKGQLWYNQNWLTHVMQYWIYEHISPNGVIYFTWAMSASIFALVLAACYLRTRHWLGSLAAAAVVALGCRDFLSARPATTGFFCIASLWALICALEGQDARRRWWPIVLLLPLLLFWGNAHGSFVFAYGMVALYVGYWCIAQVVPRGAHWLVLPMPLMLLSLGVLALPVFLNVLPPAARELPLLNLAADVNAVFASNQVVRAFLAAAGLVAYPILVLAMRLRPQPPAIGMPQVVGIIAALVGAVILTIALGPFGVGNFIHPAKVAGSELFRTVSEWRPPFQVASFPPVWRFWLLLSLAAALLPLAGLAGLLGRMFAVAAPETREQRSLYWSPYDVAAIILGLAMTLWARRFAPMFLIFAAPAVVTWVLLLTRGMPAAARRWAALGLMGASAIGALGVTVETATKAHKELVKSFRDMPNATLLERVTRYDVTPHEAILFLARNDLACNLMTEWTQAGPVMFFAPVAKVYMDGRSQQVYTEEHYRRYVALFNAVGVPAERVGALLARLVDESDTNALLLRKSAGIESLWSAVEQDAEWKNVLFTPRWALFLRQDSPPERRVRQLAAEGRLWWPDLPEAGLARANLCLSLSPPDFAGALQAWNGAVRADFRFAGACYPSIARMLRRLNRVDEGRRYFASEAQRFEQAGGAMDEKLRAAVQAALRRAREILEREAPDTRTESRDNGESAGEVPP